MNADRVEVSWDAEKNSWLDSHRSGGGSDPPPLQGIEERGRPDPPNSGGRKPPRMKGTRLLPPISLFAAKSPLLIAPRQDIAPGW